jgi:hypothetical protein
MNVRNKALSIRALQWVLGVVVLIESLIVAFSYKEVAAANHIGLPNQVIFVLAVFEIAGAILFLIRRTLSIGFYVLLGVFACAVIIHLLHGQYNVGGLFIYGAAVIVVYFHMKGVKHDG